MKTRVFPLSLHHLQQVFTSNWRRMGAILFISFHFSHLSLAQSKIWDKTFGGNSGDILTSIQRTSDGGYIVGGTSYSDAGGDKTEGKKGRYDSGNYWVIKLRADGSKVWDKTIGGRDFEYLRTVQQTSDGGYLLGGTSRSRISGDKTEANRGPLHTSDYWIVKLNANGQKIWDKTFGGEGNDLLASVQQTNDGGYILGGSSNSGRNGDKTEPNDGFDDYWIVKLNADGTKSWDKTFGGNKEDMLLALEQTADEGYILGGSSDSGKSGDKTEAYKGGWLVKLKADGTKEWDKAIISSRIAALQQTPDGGYILGSTSLSKVSYQDYAVTKLEADGTKIWEKTIVGNKEDNLTSLHLTNDGGYLLGGTSNSDASGDKREGNQGFFTDYWIVKLNPDGTKHWDKTIGGNNEDILAAVLPTPDGNYILGGYSRSDVSGDKSGISKGETDYWIVKLDNNISHKKEQTITFAPLLNQDLTSTPITLKVTATSGLPVSFSIISGPATIKGNQLTVTGTGTVTVQAAQAGNEHYDAAREVTRSFDVYNSPVTQLWNKTYGGAVTVTPQGPEQECNDFGTSTFAAMVATPDGGYLLGGSSDSKKGGDKSEDYRGESTACANPYNGPIMDYWVVKTDAAGRKLWDKTFGGNNQDQLVAMVATQDGGYLLGGMSHSSKSNDKSEPNQGESFNGRYPADYWIVKIDANGNKLWDKTYGSTEYDTFTSLIATPDGGFLLGGYTYGSISGDKSENGSSDQDYWVVKVDANGNKHWDKAFSKAGTNYNYLRAMAVAPDGGYLLGGFTNIVNGDINNGWIVKIGTNGEKLWDKSFGGNGADVFNSIVTTPDGGFLLGGFSGSGISGDKSQPSRGEGDYWLVKINGHGQKLWDKTYGGNSHDELKAMVATPDGGYVLGGNSSSSVSGEKSEANRGDEYTYDYWIVKVDAAGQKLWDKTFGGSSYEEEFRALLADPDGSYVLGGYSNSPVGGDRLKKLKGLQDYWIIKVKEKDPQITSTWNMRYGGTGTDNFTSVIKTADGGYLSGGYTTSGAMGDKSQTSQGNNDYWIVKSDQNGKKVWDKRYGGTGDDYLNRVIQTQDGGYLLAGSSLSGKNGDKSEDSRGDRDFWVIKVDAQGNKQWDKRFGGSGYDELKKVYQLPSGRYILAGTSNSAASGDKRLGSQGGQDYWVVKISASGERIWDRRYGGAQDDVLAGLAPTPDGGFLLGGTSASGAGGDKSQANRGGSDYWLVRIDGDGNLLWDKTYGGSSQDEVNSVGRSGADFFISGSSSSDKSGEKSQNSQGNYDYWVVKITDAGTKIWDKTFGGNASDYLYASTYTKEGNIVLAGTSYSGAGGDKTQSNQGGSDYWVVQVDKDGKKVQDQRFGGSGTEELRTVFQTSDGGLLLGGRSDSGVSGDRTQPSQGGTDYWLVKVAPLTTSMIAARAASIAEEAITQVKEMQGQAYPNPFSERVTINFTLPETQQVTVKVYDGQGNEVATLFNSEVKANQVYEVEWKAANKPAGLYFLQLQTPTKKHQQKLLLAK